MWLRVAVLLLFLSPVRPASPNKLVFFDGQSNAEIGVFRDRIIVNFKHNEPGFLLMAFGDDHRRPPNQHSLSRRLRLRRLRRVSSHRRHALRRDV